MDIIEELNELIREGQKFSFLNFLHMQPFEKGRVQKWANKVQIFAANNLRESEQRILANPCFYLRTNPVKENYEELINALKGFLEYYQSHPEMLAKSKKTLEPIETKDYDVFISHARKDKLTYVNSLKNEIKKLGVNIFYDTDVIDWGDNWKAAILDGTAKSEFAIIVISENFFGREWTEIELKEFLERQNATKQKIVLPLLHGITVEKLKEKYPSLGDIQCVSTAEKNKKEIAIIFARQLIRRLKREQ